MQSKNKFLCGRKKWDKLETREPKKRNSRIDESMKRESWRYGKRGEYAEPEIKQARELQEAANDQRRISVPEITIYPRETEG